MYKNRTFKATVVLFLFLFFTGAVQLQKSKSIHQEAYYFEITDMELIYDGELAFYHKSKRLYFPNFKLKYDDGIKIGDSIRKNSCSEYLIIYRKDKSGKYYEYMKVKESGMFPFTWLCG